MTDRQGLGTFEFIFLTLFFTMLGATLLMLWDFSVRDDFPKAGRGDLIAEYQRAVELMADDTLTAVSCEAATESIVLKKSSGATVEWAFYNESLYRKSPESQPQAIVSGLKEAGFATATSTPDFFSIWLVPIASDRMPIFTSFALRGNGL